MKLSYSKNLTKKPNNLIFSGGGILGIAYVGCLQALEGKGLLSAVKNFAGASAGAINAFCCALGYTSKELDTILEETPFPTLLDTYSGLDIPRMIKDPVYAISCLPWALKDLITHQGLCKGESPRAWFMNLLKKKKFAGNITFEALYKKTGKGLYIVNCDLSTKTQKIRSHKHTPGMRVVDAVLASMTIPFVYTPVISDNDAMVDGGTTYNLPIDLFDDTEDKATLGFILSTQEEIENPDPVKINDIIDFLGQFYATLKNTSYALLFSKQENIDRTIFIDTCGIHWLNFAITKDERKKLIASGKRATEEYLK